MYSSLGHFYAYLSERSWVINLGFWERKITSIQSSLVDCTELESLQIPSLTPLYDRSGYDDIDSERKMLASFKPAHSIHWLGEHIISL